MFGASFLTLAGGAKHRLLRDRDNTHRKFRVVSDTERSAETDTRNVDVATLYEWTPVGNGSMLAHTLLRIAQLNLSAEAERFVRGGFTIFVEPGTACRSFAMETVTLAVV
jgi:hypothetical protein